MAEPMDTPIGEQLIDRRSRLEDALSTAPSDQEIRQLLVDVDAAIERVGNGTYGLCEVCHEAVEPDRLLANPLVCVCLDHMTAGQRQALEEDLVLASKIQKALLPQQSLRTAGWETAYHYQGAGPVGGDYCDLLVSGEDLYFMVGDVSGKGVSASMLMAHLQATFRGLVSLDLPLPQILERASRMFCESTLPTYFATLVCGKAHAEGDIEVCNAGHNPPLLIRGGKIEEVKATGLPLGLFCEEHFAVSRVQLAPGDSILIYTDGLSEAENASGLQYGAERLFRVLEECRLCSPKDIATACLTDLDTFLSGAARVDDLTIMVIQKLGRE